MPLLLLVLLSVVNAAKPAGPELADPRFDREILAGIDCVLRQQYDSATVVFDRITQADPRYPAGPFFKAALLAARFYDCNDTSAIPAFYRLCDRVLLLTENRKEPIYQFYRGGIFGYQSVMYSKEGRWVAGARSGKKSVDLFRKLLRDRVTCSDALGMVGSYHYWTSSFMKHFRWLPFVQDNREAGIAEIKSALPRARYLKFALLNSQLWIYYDHGRYREALSLCDGVLAQYPGHRIFLSVRMHILYKLREFPSAEKTALSLIKAYQRVEQVPVNYNAARIKLALIYYSTGRRVEADRLVRDLNINGFSETLRRRLEKDLGFLEKARY